MTFKNHVVFFAAAIALSGGSALAQTQPSTDTGGPYVGAGIGVTGYGLKKEDFTSAGSAGRRFDERDGGLKVFGGYRFNEYLAVEGQVASLGKAEVTYRDAAGRSVGKEKYSLAAASVAAVGSWPLGAGFSVFGKAGPAVTRASSSFSVAGLGSPSKATKLGAVVGLGVSYRITDKLSLRGEYEQFLGAGKKDRPGRSTVGLLSAGLQYSF
jgi:OmpA-OmpF porin, OOP family